jgi:hypothetical protein
MIGLVDSVRGIWAVGVVAQVAVCGLLLLKGHFRKLRVFTAYIALNICESGFLYFVYGYFGFSSHTAFVLAWLSEASILILRSLATTEVLRLVLRPYSGIWGLGWRVLAVAYGAVLSYAAIDAGSNAGLAIVVADRGFHLAFAVALVACLLLVRHYSIPVDPVYKGLLGGFCFYSCALVVANTVGQALFLRQSADFQPIWQAAPVAAYAVVQVLWTVALRKPLAVEEKQHVLLPASIYREISPEINQRLHLLNEQLVQFWKPEATQQ